VFSEAVSDAEVKNQKLVAEKADLSFEAADLPRPASVVEKADLSVEAADLSRPASSDDVVVFPEAVSDAEVKNQKLVAEKAKLSTKDLSPRGGGTDMVNSAPAAPDDLKLDELRSALSKALEPKSGSWRPAAVWRRYRRVSNQ
jgi:hypothetical protein